MMQNQHTDVYSVSSLTRELKSLVELKYRFIQVQGEVSNLKIPFSGHAYFTLKDEGAQLKAVLFKGQARYLDKVIQDGQEILCYGRLSVYEPRGDYQIIVDSINFQGSGLLQQRFDELKRRLATEGLFDQTSKKDLPAFPREVVLITSPSGAAVHDFLKSWRNRAFPSNISIFPVRVQGENSGAEIAEAITTVGRALPDTDIIVLCRGGGSLEDLWAFNEEIVARAIARASIPIVSAVGHEIDFSISDFCADLRAATPTAAAEIIFPDRNELKEGIRYLQRGLTNSIRERIDQYQGRIDQNRRLLGDMNFLFTNSALRLDHAGLRLHAVMKKRMENCIARCREISTRLQNTSPVTKVQMQEQRLNFVTEKLGYLLQHSLGEKETMLKQQATLLDSVSPLRTMERGYSITSRIYPRTGRKTLIRDSRHLKKDDLLEIRLHKGTVKCGVIETLDSLDE